MSIISTRTDIDSPSKNLDGRVTAGQMLSAKSPRILNVPECTINGSSYSPVPFHIRSEASPAPKPSLPLAEILRPSFALHRSSKSSQKLKSPNSQSSPAMGPSKKSISPVAQVFNKVQAVKYMSGSPSEVMSTFSLELEKQSIKLEGEKISLERAELDKDILEFEKERCHYGNRTIIPVKGDIPIRQSSIKSISPMYNNRMPNISTDGGFIQRHTMQIGGFNSSSRNTDKLSTVEPYNQIRESGNYRQNKNNYNYNNQENSPKTPTFAMNFNRQHVAPNESKPISFSRQTPSTPPPTGCGDTRPDYSLMSREQKADMRVVFRAKFGTLRASFTEWNIQDPNNDMSLDEIHDTYEGYVRQIMISLNSSNWKTYLAIMFLGIEVIGIKVFGLDFRGYTMSQMKTIKTYDRLLIQLGEKYYVQGTSNWPIETQFLMMGGFNALIFLAVKYLSKWCGGESMAGTMQDLITSFLGGEGMLNSPKTNKDENGISVIPGIDKNEKAAPAGGGLNSLLSSLAPMLGGMMGGDSSGGNGNGDMSEMVAKLGNMFTQGMGAPKDKSSIPSTTSAPKRKRRAFG
jgi:hypothetical protein